MPTDPTRRAALLNMKLRTLVRDHVGHELGDLSGTEPMPFGRGAALVADGTAWLLLAEQPERSLGGALAWATRQPTASEYAIIAEAGTGVLFRRARLFDLQISVWHAVERMLVPAVTEPYPSRDRVDSTHDELRSLIEAGGAEPIEEHGVLSGEVRGLEVCRVVDDATTGEVRLEVGVGAHDREAFLMIHGGRPTVEALSDVVAAVELHRREGAPYHPLNKLGAERFLRWSVLRDPHRLGAAELHAAAPPVVRANVKDPVPSVAVGSRADGTPLVVVTSTGIDLDLVPFALDAREMHHPDAELLLVVPSRDASPVTRSLAAAARRPPTIVPWD
ncbi:MAG: hypothetical protein JWL72_3947 [Ilumatobacteraceae bacterium]|nr:hypothetical protein [Ilumatobacteraceae bacterium]MCU1390609.1 hypothetical protein [Ilumatobacteraceae bacterium]